jgi:predicted Asp-tRNA(Asn)/Glu-tRNA(Gln) amidotransferase subunit C
MERINHAEIEKQAKGILEKFAKALEKVDSKSNEIYVDRAEFERKEKDGKICEGFKRKLLENAPKKDNDFILVERGNWK